MAAGATRVVAGCASTNDDDDDVTIPRLTGVIVLPDGGSDADAGFVGNVLRPDAGPPIAVGIPAGVVIDAATHVYDGGLTIAPGTQAVDAGILLVGIPPLPVDAGVVRDAAPIDGGFVIGTVVRPDSGVCRPIGPTDGACGVIFPGIIMHVRDGERELPIGIVIQAEEP